MKLSSLLLAASLVLSAAPSSAAPLLLLDASSGDILAAQEATRSWHPASLTKLMTAHLALSAVRSGRLSLNSSIILSAKAAGQAPSKLGVSPGTSIRLEDALLVMMVKSANDVAVAIAEAVSGSETAFVTAMNAEASRLGMSGTRFVNASGLHHDRQVSNARDMAVLMLAILSYHEDHVELFRTSAVTVNGRILKNTNKLVEDYAGLEATKTGYVCASGFNVAVSVIRGGRRVVGVVLGAPSATTRTRIVREILDAGLTGTTSPIGNLRTVKADAPAPGTDLRRHKCGRQGPAIGTNAAIGGDVKAAGTPRLRR
ncbi:D-alanyl-D-alanine carboxypeptidase family protein [Microvirga guangxiensis]|uniref:D-alanyl-D-alanine carboxypeptidase n=1 Tax=Microvirga guangxiensis TaxID=549386 RepID=A0A1G5L0J7_9HYPH|nr:D-alanyl-D-alanine carboxypeptidase family protein [Microvirga guangxiensis]SCZ05951.1 D-alanyl-D-alanine carboxypeptidase [Microvirga guangxiensis]